MTKNSVELELFPYLKMKNGAVNKDIHYVNLLQKYFYVNLTHTTVFKVYVAAIVVE